MNEFEIVAESRAGRGKSAARRLRREGKVPGIVYGADEAPVSVTLVENSLRRQMEQEGFFSHILTLKVDGEAPQQTVVKALHRHPATARVLHVDLLRVRATQKLTLTVPLRFEGEEDCPGVKEGGVVSHQVTEIEISCLPGDLPEAIVVDASGLALGDALHVSAIALPRGVEIPSLTEENDPQVLGVSVPVAAEEEETEEGEAAEGEGGGIDEAPGAASEGSDDED